MSKLEQVDSYLNTLDGWMKEKAVRIRELIHQADPEIVEEWKWGTSVYSDQGQVCAIAVFSDHLKINFFKGSNLQDPDHLFNAGLEAKKSRAVDIYQGDKLDETALVRLVQSAAALNR